MLYCVNLCLSLTDTPHSIWVDDSCYHHCQLHRSGSGTASARWGQDAALRAPGRLSGNTSVCNRLTALFQCIDDVLFPCEAHCYWYHSQNTLNLCKTKTSTRSDKNDVNDFTFPPTPFLHPFPWFLFPSGWHRALLHRDLLFRVWNKDSRPWFRLSQEFLPKEWMERHGLCGGAHRVSDNREPITADQPLFS